MFDLNKITRKNIINLEPYSSARDEFEGQSSIWLDANENPFNTDFNRYPDPHQIQLKNKIAEVKNVNINEIIVGNGSDELIDLLFKAFCEPEIDAAYLFPPTYGMYEVSAKINNVKIVKIPLTKNFDLPSLETIFKKVNSNGILFICSPNNPTGNTFNIKKIQEIAQSFGGIVVVDEAYIDFSEMPSALQLINSTPNLVVLQTFSKALGLAGLRLGLGFANKKIISVLNKIKPPYNVNTFTQQMGLKVLKNNAKIKSQIKIITNERAKLIEKLNQLSIVKKSYPTQANFVLVIFDDANRVYQFLIENGIVIRNRSSQVKQALRITIGTPEENDRLITTLKKL
ncbi:MAG: histidinol-phosphate transaminase [Lutibacter sp.]